MIVISEEIDQFLIKDGCNYEDLHQIKKCFHKCKFKMAKMPREYSKMTTADFDVLQYKRCSRQKALDVLGWQEFWLGLERTAFHASTSREKSNVSIHFSWDFWKE